MKKNIVCLAITLCFFLFSGCGGGGGNESGNAPQSSVETPPQIQEPITEHISDQVPEGDNSQTPQIENEQVNPAPELETVVEPLLDQLIDSDAGGSVQALVSTENAVKLEIPAESLNESTVITVGKVNNPPALPVGFNFVGSVLDFGPDGTTFSNPGTLEISFSEEDLEIAGVESESSLKILSYSETSNRWSEAKVKSIDTVNNKITGEVNHFSFYTVVGLSGQPPEDLGTPQIGDLLFKLSSYDGGKTSGWIPGHVGIFVGEEEWDGTGLATDFVKFFGKYNAVEAMLQEGVRYAYYNIPNSIESYMISAMFENDSVYMGARELKYNDVTFEQRKKIVEYVKKQVGKPYLNFDELYGLRDGRFAKGPDRYNCVGLAEAAYEYAFVHDGHGILPYDDYKLLTPAKMYAQTKPASGHIAQPVIEWATLSPDHGTTQTEMLAQIAVSHEYGLDYIDSVTYKTDSGFIDPNIPINDKGLYGDIKAGDGIYSAKAQVGGKQTDGILGLNFIVTDKSGKSATIRKEFRYVIVVTVPVNYVSRKTVTDKWVK